MRDDFGTAQRSCWAIGINFFFILFFHFKIRYELVFSKILLAVQLSSTHPKSTFNLGL